MQGQHIQLMQNATEDDHGHYLTARGFRWESGATRKRSSSAAEDVLPTLNETRYSILTASVSSECQLFQQVQRCSTPGNNV